MSSPHYKRSQRGNGRQAAAQVVFSTFLLLLLLLGMAVAVAVDKASCSTSLKAAKVFELFWNPAHCRKAIGMEKILGHHQIKKWSLSINNHDSSVQVIVSKEVEWFQNGDTTVTWLISILIFIWYTNFCISVGTSELSFCSTRWSRHFRGRRGPVLAPRRWIT